MTKDDMELDESLVAGLHGLIEFERAMHEKNGALLIRWDEFLSKQNQANAQLLKSFKEGSIYPDPRMLDQNYFSRRSEVEQAFLAAKLAGNRCVAAWQAKAQEHFQAYCAEFETARVRYLFLLEGFRREFPAESEDDV